MSVSPAIAAPILWRQGNERLVATPLGRDAWRIRSSDLPDGLSVPLPSALLADEPASLLRDAVNSAAGIYPNGDLELVLSAQGGLAFRRASDGLILLGEQAPVQGSARDYRDQGAGHAVAATFAAHAGEHLYGLGQHPHGRLDQKGCVIPLEQRNTQVAVPVLISSRGYGFIWNLPAVGRAEFCDRRCSCWGS